MRVRAYFRRTGTARAGFRGFFFCAAERPDVCIQQRRGSLGNNADNLRRRSFEGTYSDSDMGDSGEGYPNGTVYLSEFQGRFSEPSKVNDYTYSVKIQEMTLAEDVGTSQIIDGTRYVYSEPYGLDGAEELLFYLPGAPLAELPEAYRSWVGYYDLSAAEVTELPFTGLYNAAAESGFSSYEQIAQDSGIEAELAAIEAQRPSLKPGSMKGRCPSQSLPRRGELYSLWDAELNSIWERIGALLPKEEMAQLTSEELAWIQEKETAVAQAGAEFEGGSAQPFIENSTAARLTRERVYELAVYLGYTGESDGGQTNSGTAYGLEPDTVYTLDLDGDGTGESFSFSHIHRRTTECPERSWNFPWTGRGCGP